MAPHAHSQNPCILLTALDSYLSAQLARSLIDKGGGKRRAVISVLVVEEVLKDRVETEGVEVTEDADEEAFSSEEAGEDEARRGRTYCSRKRKSASRSMPLAC